MTAFTKFDDSANAPTAWCDRDFTSQVKSSAASGPILPFLVLAILLGASASPAVAQCAELTGCELVWSDEFDGDAVDETKWSFQRGTGTEVGLPPGWGNNELQFYRAENATVADGFLTITAKEEFFSGRNYTSARLRSLGKGDWSFGRMEMRAKMPIGQGLWPAFWMLPSDPSIYGTWAASGEIDIVEYLGSDPDRIFGTLHYGGPYPDNVFSSSSYFLPSGTFHDGFHVFAVEWELGEFRWYIDGLLYAVRTSWYSTGGPFPAPFDVDFHLLLNLAVGGNLPGPPDSSTSFPQEYVIDYVRVYQIPSTPAEVMITSPTTGDVIPAGTDLTISVDATDDGAVQLVQFLQGNVLLGEDTTAPYELTIPGVAAGCYTLQARARDDIGLLSFSDPVDIMVGSGCQQAPYAMTPVAVPGIIEAEAYDLGGEGVAYTDFDATNNGGGYRPDEAVDLESTTDAGFGFNVGWTVPGEWIEYTMEPIAGTYDLSARVASEAVGGTFHLEVDGVDVTGPVSFPRTFGWQNWVTTPAGRVTLDGGVQTLRFVFDAGEFNLNKITVSVPPPAEQSNNCGITTDDPCQRGGICWIAGSNWQQSVTITRADGFVTETWASLCDRVQLALTEGDCDPPGGQTDVTASLTETSFANIPLIEGMLTCAEGSSGTVGAVPNGLQVPGVPLTLEAPGDGTLSLSWGASCQAGDSDYVVYEGALGSFTSHTPATCSTGGTTSWTLTPAEGNRYYLVSPTDGAAEGSQGVDSAGAERAPGATTCAPQSVRACP